MNSIYGLLAALGVAAVVIAAGHTRRSKRMAEPRGLRRPSGAPTGTALSIAVVIAVAGIVVGTVTGQWIWFAAVGVGASIGAARFLLFKRTGIWR
jgi:hypothetical protein